MLLDVGNGFERGFDYYGVEPGTEQIRRVLQQSARGGPRFLYFHFVEPHDPYQPVDDFDRFEPRPLPPERIEAFRDYLAEVDPSLSATDIEERVEVAAASMSRDIARYDGEIRQVDAIFGTILDILERQGRLEQTVVVVASDHGEALWQHREATSALRADHDPLDLRRAFKMTHNSLLYEALVHVPLIFAGPGVPADLVLERPVANIDIAPTVLDLLGLEVPREMDGVSLVDDFDRLARGEQAVGRELVHAHTSIYTSVRSRRGHKLIVPWEDDGPDGPEYYRLDQDEDERDPLPFQGDAVERLTRSVRDFRRTALTPEGDEDVIDSVTRERMRQLGYVDR